MRPVCVCLLNVYKIFTVTEGTLTSLLLPTRPWHPDAHRLTPSPSHTHTHTHTPTPHTPQHHHTHTHPPQPPPPPPPPPHPPLSMSTSGEPAPVGGNLSPDCLRSN